MEVEPWKVRPDRVTDLKPGDHQHKPRCGGFLKMVVPNSWMIYKGKTQSING